MLRTVLATRRRLLRSRSVIGDTKKRRARASKSSYNVLAVPGRFTDKIARHKVASDFRHTFKAPRFHSFSVLKIIRRWQSSGNPDCRTIGRDGS